MFSGGHKKFHHHCQADYSFVSVIDISSMDHVRVYSRTDEEEERLITQSDPAKSTHRLRPIVFKDGQRCCLIQASMSMGKSFQTKAFLSELFARNQEARVLCVSARIQQGYTIRGQLSQFRFQHYKDPGVDILGAPRLIIQYESLWKLQNAAVFDAVVIDEYRGVCAQIPAPTHVEKQTANFRTFLSLHHRSRRTLFLDAFMHVDGMVESIIGHTHKPLDQAVTSYVYTHTFLKRVFILYPSDICLLDKIISQMHTNISRDCKDFRIGILCRSAIKLQTIYQLLRDEFGLRPDVDILAFCGDTSEQGMRRFVDIDRHLEGVRVLLFTSKVTVGADIQTQFSQLFIDASSYYGPCARDVFQMLGRFRQLRDSHIHIAIPQKTSRSSSVIETTFEHELSILKEVDTLNTGMFSEFSQRGFTRGMTPGDFDLFCRICAYSNFENQRSWTGQFRELCVAQGYSVEPAPNMSPSDLTRISHMRKRIDVYHKAQMTKRRASVLSQAHVQIESMGDPDAPPSSNSRVERIVADALNFIPLSKLTPECIGDLCSRYVDMRASLALCQELVDHKHPQSTQWINTNDGIDVRDQDMRLISSSGGLAHNVSVASEAASHVAKIFTHFGNRVRGRVYHWEFTRVAIVQNSAEITHHLRSASIALRSRVCIDQTTRASSHTIIQSLKRQLSTMGMEVQQGRFGSIGVKPFDSLLTLLSKQTSIHTAQNKDKPTSQKSRQPQHEKKRSLQSPCVAQPLKKPCIYNDPIVVKCVPE